MPENSQMHGSAYEKDIVSDVRPGYVRPSTPLKYLVQHLQIGKLYKRSIMDALAHWGKLCS